MGVGQPGGLPMPAIGNPAQVRKDIKRMSSSIWENYGQLKAILERHEATIQKRWMKKTQDQRRKILQSAWGGKLPPTHRPDFQAFRQKGSGPLQGSDTRLRDSFMWPSINDEDLTKPRALLLLMNARGRNEPAAFAAADGEAQHLGKVTAAIMPLFLNEHIMIFTGAHDANNYGRLMSWDDHPDAFEWMTTRKHPQPGEGLLILEAQQRLMEFLVAAAKQILHDTPEDAILDHPLQTEPLSLSENEVGFASLAVMASEGPYRVPAQLSFARIESLLKAKRDAAADHMWSLREDPGYFRDLVLTVREHRQEMMNDTRGQQHPLSRFGREDVVWTRTVSHCVNDAFLQYEGYPQW